MSIISYPLEPTTIAVFIEITKTFMRRWIKTTVRIAFWFHNVYTSEINTCLNWFGPEGLFIESWSGSAGYPAEMLTEDGISWRVEDESTLASSVNIEAEYPALADHEEIA